MSDKLLFDFNMIKNTVLAGKERRVRQNRRLFRMLTPRNAIAALNELHGQGITESTIVPTLDGQFEAEITINNVRFVGIGKTKMHAKNAASEKALRDLMIQKLQQEACAAASKPQSAEGINSDGGDDVPMMQLASFALYKLFSEWEAAGFEVPMLKPNVRFL